MYSKQHHYKPRVLFVDDDEAGVRVLTHSLRRIGADFNFDIAHSAQVALSLVTQYQPEVAVVDLTIDSSVGPDSGYKLIDQLLNLDPSIRIIVLTAHIADEYGIKSLLHGAASFLTKPVDPTHLRALIEDAISYATLKKKYLEYTNESNNLEKVTGIFSKSPTMKAVKEAVAFAATNKQPLLLVGETGVGKGVIAQSIHRTGNSNAPFIRFQPKFGGSDLISSELFGHVKGAFTGASENRKGLIEEANNGTLFLDEVDELPNETQVLLLNVLQEKVFRKLGSNKEQHSNFRLVAATNQNIEKLLETKKLRKDFYHRIAHFTIEVPPLRERVEDIPDLINNIITNITNNENISIHGITQEALSKLCAYDFPGNIRELQAIVEGAIYHANFENRRFIQPSDIRISAKSSSTPKPGSFRERVETFEQELVREALNHSENNQTEAAKFLKLDRSTFRRILNRSRN